MAMLEVVVQLQIDAFNAHAPTVAATATTAPTERTEALTTKRVLGFRLPLENVERFRVGGSQRVAKVVAGRSRVAVGLIGGVVAEAVGSLVESHHREIGITVVAVPIVDVRTDGYVTTFVAKTAVELQLRTDIFVFAVAHRFVLTAVHYEILLIHLLNSFLAQRVGDVVERVGIKRCRSLPTATVVGRETQVRAEGEGGERVDGPLKVHVARPAVVARIALADIVRKGTTTRVDEVLRPCATPVVGTAMRPRHTAAHPQVLVVLVADVEGGCFRVTLAVAIATTSSATT